MFHIQRDHVGYSMSSFQGLHCPTAYEMLSQISNIFTYDIWNVMH